jgi:catechol 2,3-dioxygenase-like lactoylglutathione lyase family enzyme
MATASSPSSSYAVGYHHLALVCTNVAASVDFYTKLGFRVRAAHDGDKAVLYNESGLELHLFRTSANDDDVVDKKEPPHNVLMDDTETKYPGHTHFCIGVGSVPQTRKYLESIGFVESGARDMFGFVASVFYRDPDRTVVELERNDGEDDGRPVTAETLSKAPRGGMDHVGTRVTKVPTTSAWYRKHLGLSKDIMVYEVDLEHPKKNGRPWILRTPPEDFEVSVDINLIPNGTTEDPVNILTSSEKEPLPGILYVCYQVTSIEEAVKGLDPSNIANSPDELAAWGVSAKFVNQVCPKSCFVRDLDHSLFRLIEL